MKGEKFYLPVSTVVAVQCVGEELCPAYTSCRTNNATGVSACYPDCQVLNGGCPANLRCKVSRYSYGNDEDSDEDSDTEHSDSDDEDGGHGVGDSDEEGHGDEHDDDGSRGDGRDGDGHDGDDDDDDDFYSGSPIDYFPSCTEHPYGELICNSWSVCASVCTSDLMALLPESLQLNSLQT